MVKLIKESWLVLVMGVGFACLLAAAQASLLPKIEENKSAELRTALNDVLPSEIAKEVSGEPEEKTVEGHRVFRMKNSAGETLGWVVQGTGTGFVDKITLVAGISPDLKTITGIKVLECLETPGLGDKIKAGKSNFPNQFKDLNADKLITVIKSQKVNREDNQIEAITGATYSSNYTTDIVNAIMEKVRPLLKNWDSLDTPKTPEG